MSRSDFTTHYVHTDFGVLAYHVKGNLSSRKAFIYLHGQFISAMENETRDIFESDEHLQILIDHRWHGCSTRTYFYPSISERATDIDIVIADVQKRFASVADFNLIGFSQGGTVLLYYLLGEFDQIDKVRKACVIGPRLNLKSHLIWFKEEVSEMEKVNKDGFAKKYKIKGWVNFSRKYVEEFNNIDLYQLASKLRTPLTLVRSDRDTLISKEDALKFVNQKADLINYHEITDADHILTVPQFQSVYNLIAHSY